MASLGEPGSGGDRSAPARSGASQGVREKPGHFGQDGPDRRRIDRLLHGVPPGGRTPATKRKQLVEMRKRHALHCKAGEKTGAAGEFEDLDVDVREVLDRRIKDLEQRIKTCLDSGGALSEIAAVLRSVPEIGLVACAMPVAEMPELGRISGEQAAALAGLAPVAREADDRRRPPGAPMRPASSRACRFDPQHGPKSPRQSAAEGGEAAQGRRHGRRPQARRDRQRLVQITRIMGGESRMTDLRCRGRMGLWECGQSKPGPRHGRKRRKGLSTFPRSPRRRERKTAERPKNTKIRNDIRVHH